MKRRTRSRKLGTIGQTRKENQEHQPAQQRHVSWNALDRTPEQRKAIQKFREKVTREMLTQNFGDSCNLS
jgi:hypothetical protein